MARRSIINTDNPIEYLGGMAFTWSAQYETNISKVDEQHQTIINQINQFLE